MEGFPENMQNSSQFQDMLLNKMQSQIQQNNMDSLGNIEMLGKDINNQIRTQMPTQEQNIDFYNEFCRLFIANNVLQGQIKELNNEKQEITQKMHQIEKQLQQYNQIQVYQESKKKRQRRLADDIVRNFQCPINNCWKSYGSEGSLNQHLKLKHPQYYHQIFTQSNGSESKNQNSKIDKI